jgi:hypothetical protein
LAIGIRPTSRLWAFKPGSKGQTTAEPPSVLCYCKSCADELSQQVAAEDMAIDEQLLVGASGFGARALLGAQTRYRHRQAPLGNLPRYFSAAPSPVAEAGFCGPRLVIVFRNLIIRELLDKCSNGPDFPPPIPIEDAATIRAGARAFASRGCSNCHGAPGVIWAKFSEGLRPDPPDLKDIAKDLTPAQVFWCSTGVEERSEDTGWMDHLET